MRYLVTIYTHDYTFAGIQGFTGTEPNFETPSASVVVSGSSSREAAARAYVRCVGRKRARAKQANPGMPRNSVAQETSRKAIAASLRKTMQRIGECYELDNFLHGWFIKVEPVTSAFSLPRCSRLSSPMIHRHSPSPSPN